METKKLRSFCNERENSNKIFKVIVFQLSLANLHFHQLLTASSFFFKFQTKIAQFFTNPRTNHSNGIDFRLINCPQFFRLNVQLLMKIRAQSPQHCGYRLVVGLIFRLNQRVCDDNTM